MNEKEYRYRLKGKLITYRNSLNLPKNVTFGIEIEYENIVKDKLTYLIEEERFNNNHLHDWINKIEPDIVEWNKFSEEVNGEVSSPILRDEIRTWKNLRVMVELLYKNDAIITEKCGGHVNIGSHLLENNCEYWRNLFLLWILYNREIYKFSSGEFIKVRLDNDKYFQNVKDELDIQKLLNVKRKNYLITLSDCIFDKYHDIYTSTTNRKKIIEGNRIEFRVPNCTLKEEIWQNYINFFTKFILACKKELDIEKTLYKIKNDEHNAVELADYIFEDQIDKDNFLIQTLKTNKIYKKELVPHISHNTNLHF